MPGYEQRPCRRDLSQDFLNQSIRRCRICNLLQAQVRRNCVPRISLEPASQVPATWLPEVCDATAAAARAAASASPRYRCEIGPHRIVEFVDERDSRRNVQLDDVGVGDVVEVFHQRAQAELPCAVISTRWPRAIAGAIVCVQYGTKRATVSFSDSVAGRSVGRQRRVARIVRWMPRVVDARAAAAACRSCGARSWSAPRRAWPRFPPCSAPAARRSAARSAASRVIIGNPEQVAARRAPSSRCGSRASAPTCRRRRT